MNTSTEAENQAPATRETTSREENSDVSSDNTKQGSVSEGENVKPTSIFEKNALKGDNLTREERIAKQREKYISHFKTENVANMFSQTIRDEIVSSENRYIADKINEMKDINFTSLDKNKRPINSPRSFMSNIRNRYTREEGAANDDNNNVGNNRRRTNDNQNRRRRNRK